MLRSTAHLFELGLQPLAQPPLNQGEEVIDQGNISGRETISLAPNCHQACLLELTQLAT